MAADDAGSTTVIVLLKTLVKPFMDWRHRVQIVKEKVKGAGHDWGAGNLAATLSLSLEAARALDTLPRRSCSCIDVRRKIITFFFFTYCQRHGSGRRRLVLSPSAVAFVILIEFVIRVQQMAEGGAR